MSPRARTTRARPDGAETRARLLDEAEAMLVSEGYLGSSLETLAARLGLTKAALYYHFPGGKEELFVALVHRSLRDIQAGLTTALASAPSGAEGLRAAARWMLGDSGRARHMEAARDVARHALPHSQPGMAEGFSRALLEPIHQAISAAVASGEFRREDPVFLTWAFLGLIGGLAESTDDAHLPGSWHPGSGADLADRLTEMFLRGVLAEERG